MVDFSIIPAEELSRNFTTRGGHMEVKSRERAIQEQRESTTLIAIYSSSADIPLSPREPPEPYSGESSEDVAFGEKPAVVQVNQRLVQAI